MIKGCAGTGARGAVPDGSGLGESTAAFEVCIGVVLVGDGETWCFIRSPTDFGVTFSTSVNDGSKRTEVGRSGAGADFVERSGIGILEADSMSLYQTISLSHHFQTCKRAILITYPIIRLNTTIPHRLHHTPLLILDIPNPIRLARRDKHMRCPSLDMSIKLLLFVDLELRRVMDCARLAVMEAILSINRRIDLWEETSLGSADEVFGVGEVGAGTVGAVGGEERGSALDEGADTGGHLLCW